MFVSLYFCWWSKEHSKMVPTWVPLFGLLSSCFFFPQRAKVCYDFCFVSFSFEMFLSEKCFCLLLRCCFCSRIEFDLCICMRTRYTHMNNFLWFCCRLCLYFFFLVFLFGFGVHVNLILKNKWNVIEKSENKNLFVRRRWCEALY